MTEPAPSRHRIVVGVDGSPQSIGALRYARTLAEALGHDLEALGAWQVRTTFEQYSPADWNPEADAREVLEEAVTEAFGSERPANLSLRLEMGPPAQVLLDASKTAAMIVVGTRGRGGFRGMIMGSVSSNVAAHAHCPVVISHGEE